MNIQDSFLLDEVRCGFMIPAAVKQAWAAELEVLMEIDRVCKKHNFPYIACVDIFVLDYVHKDPEKEEKRRCLCKYMLGVADLIAQGVLTSEEKEHRLKELEKMYGKKIRRITEPVEMRRYLYGEIEKVFGEVSEKESDTLTQLFPWGLKGESFQFPKEYYEKAIELPFENTVMPVSLMYDKMLRKRYGEYCRLVKDKAGHDYPFFEGQKKNLQKVLNFAIPEFRFECSKLFRNEDEKTCKDLSYKALAKECLGELYRMKEELTMDLLSASQQLAIDFGNMMESVLGEGCTLIELLERYCEALYAIYEQLLPEGELSEVVIVDKECDKQKQSDICLPLDDILQAIANDLEQNVFERKMVLFLPVLAKDWNSLHGLWQEYAEDESCDVYVAPLPYYYKDYDGSPKKVCYEAAEFPEAVHMLDYNILTSEYLEMLHPEIIIIQNPYDSWNPAISVPEMFYSENIRKYTDKLVYVPPFALDEYSKSNEREYSNMKYYVSMPGVVYADHIMVQSENMRQMYIEKLAEFAGEETKEVWEQRISTFVMHEAQKECNASDSECNRENSANNAKNMDSKKRMLYGISFGAYMGDVEVARSKIERNLKLFEVHKSQIDLTVGIFPDNETSKELRDYIVGVLKQYSGRILDRGTECSPLDYDAYYGDGMPLVMKFRDAGKPVMVQDIYVE